MDILGFVPSPKVKMINVRLTPAVHDQFKIACDLRGVSMSSLLYQFIVRTIREERELEPQAFEVLTPLHDAGPLGKRHHSQRKRKAE